MSALQRRRRLRLARGKRGAPRVAQRQEERSLGFRPSPRRASAFASAGFGFGFRATVGRRCNDYRPRGARFRLRASGCLRREIASSARGGSGQSGGGGSRKRVRVSLGPTVCWSENIGPKNVRVRRSSLGLAQRRRLSCRPNWGAAAMHLRATRATTESSCGGGDGGADPIGAERIRSDPIGSEAGEARARH